MFLRRHHCRYCGGVYCSNCTQNKFQTELGLLVDKICDKCYHYLTEPLAQLPIVQDQSQEPSYCTITENSDEEIEELSKNENTKRLKNRDILNEILVRETDANLEDFLELKVKEVLEEHSVDLT